MVGLQMKHRWYVILPFLTLASGCQVDLPVTAPTATVRRVLLTQRTAEGVRLEVDLELANTNTVPLGVVSGRYALQLEGIGGYEGHETLHYTIPKPPDAAGAHQAGYQHVRLPLAFPFGPGQVVDTPYEVHGWVTYEPPGEIRQLLTESGVPLPSVPFSGSGQIEAGTPGMTAVSSDTPHPEDTRRGLTNQDR